MIPRRVWQPGEFQLSRARRGSESGYAYILALMLIAAFMILSMAALKKGLAQAKRRQEALAIWRGEQYVRAIRLYYRKTQHYPQTIDDLQKGIANIHFLRPEAYKNPMNKTDGAWRLIYVNQAGQIIGSVRYANLQQMALLVLNNGQLPTTPTGQPGSPPTAAPGGTSTTDLGAQQGQNPSTGNPPTDTTGTDQSPQNPQNPQNPPSTTQPGSAAPGGEPAGQNQEGAPGQAINPLLLMKPTGPVSGPVVGGLLTGVALVPETPSQRVYQGGKKYIEWEFIWNPLVDQARAIQAGVGQGATGTLGGAPGMPGNGSNGGGLFPTTPNQPPTQPPQPGAPTQPQPLAHPQQ